MSWKTDSDRFANALITVHGSLEKAHERRKAVAPPSVRGDAMFPNRLLVDRLEDDRKLARELGEVWD